MAKKLRKKDRVRQEKAKKLKALDLYNTKAYYSDIEYIGKLNVAPSKKEWIETTMYQLRESANIYEHLLAEFLLSKKIKFIHQAPFVFNGFKIYFADFYLPDYRLVIEIDGEYHLGDRQFNYDKQRDKDFQDMRIRTARLSNNETRNKETLALRLSQYNI